MLKIDESLIGRTYYTHDRKTIYTIRGFAITGTIVVLGEFCPDPTTFDTKLTTHKVTDINLLPKK